jgi:hypothetical protein
MGRKGANRNAALVEIPMGLIHYIGQKGTNDCGIS